jgi:serine/threonine-protein kinase
MAIASNADLLDAVLNSRILTPPQLRELRGELGARYAEPRGLALELVRRSWLTPYQLTQLWSGRGPDLLLGPYLLLERLGKGGMGQVFKARHRQADRLVALKVILKERLGSPATVRRFVREIEVAAKLAHPNVVRAYEAGQAGGTPYFAMEYVEGINLAELLRRGGPFPVDLACDYVRQAATGLQHVHECGLVHRDIKPSNLLLGLKDATVKVVDLGVARVRASAAEADDRKSTLTDEGAVIGTPDYLAPEQTINSRAVDIRADVYSLGCTLYHLLAGRPPFPGGAVVEKLIKHRQEEPTPVEELRVGLAPALAAVIRAMMAKRPGDRPQTPEAVAAALGPFSGKGPGPALPPAGRGPAGGADSLQSTELTLHPTGRSAPAPAAGK